MCPAYCFLFQCASINIWGKKKKKKKKRKKKKKKKKKEKKRLHIPNSRIKQKKLVVSKIVQDPSEILVEFATELLD